jgi:hypothetical protein
MAWRRTDMLETTTEPVIDIQPKLDQFQQSAEWRALTVKQRKWFIVYLYTNDPLAATNAAFNCATETNAKCLSREMQKHHAVIAALDSWNEKSERQIVLDKLQRNIDASKPGSYVCAKFYAQWLKMKCDIDSEDGKAKPEVSATVSTVTAQRFSVGDICVQDGQRFRITSVDPNGMPLTAEPTL